MRITEEDHAKWRRFLDAVEPVVAETLGPDANFVIGAQFGEMLADTHTELPFVITSNMPIHETSAAIHDMSVEADRIGAEQAEQDERDEAALLALWAMLSGDDEAIEVVQSLDGGWAAGDDIGLLIIIEPTEV